jgi:diguanylate cyclase
MIELLCTLTGIIAGVAVVASLFHYQGDRSRFEAPPTNVDSEKIRGIADQLQVISHRVAANVSAHSEKVEHFSGKLSDSDVGQPERILSTIQEIMLANESMQGQLADAQKRIAQQSQMIEQASQQARTDALTGLANRRALDEFLTTCVNNVSEDEVVGLLLMDIDHFKSFNDSFGHTTGDAVLASFARSIVKCCGQECYAARFGGEEFAVILTAGSEEGLAQKAAEIRYYVSEQVISYEDLQLKITASAGVCILLPNDTLNAAYERADEGLYQSKKSGRNCGHWLGSQSWAPFPGVGGTPKVVADIQPESRTESSATATAASKTQPKPDSESSNPSSTPSSKQSSNEGGKELATEPNAAQPAATTQKKSADEPKAAEAKTKAAAEKAPPATPTPADKEVSDILDLNSFLVKLGSYLEQLRRAELPAAAMMVEAPSLTKLPKGRAAVTWEAVVGLAQVNLRGIDVVCLFRPYTLCIFMPGCSQDAALERAARIQHNLQDSAETWSSGDFPGKLSISIACCEPNEEVSQFLDRLERAVDEAVDASELEVVIQAGDSCHFQQV